MHNVQNSLSVKYEWSSVRSQPLVPTQWRSPRQYWKKIQPWTKDRGKGLKEPCVKRDSNNNLITIWRCVPRKAPTETSALISGFRADLVQLQSIKCVLGEPSAFVCAQPELFLHMCSWLCVLSLLSAAGDMALAFVWSCDKTKGWKRKWGHVVIEARVYIHFIWM